MGRRVAAFLGALLLVSASHAFAFDEKLQAELLDEVLRLTEAKVPDDIILKQIQVWDFEFELTADDIVELRSLGVSDAVIKALIETGLEEHRDESQPQYYYHVSAGFYSPWYWFPYAWGYYYDPFPCWYSSYYYPFYYPAPYFGRYGWAGCTYYYAYHRGMQPPRRYPHDGGGSIYLAGYLPSRRVTSVAAPNADAPQAGVVAPAQDRSRRRDTRSAVLESRRSYRLSAPTAGYRSRRVDRPSVSRDRVRQGRSGLSLPGRSSRSVLQPRRTPEYRILGERPATRADAPALPAGRGLSAPRDSREPRLHVPSRSESRPVRAFAPRDAGRTISRSWQMPRSFQGARSMPRVSAPAAAPRAMPAFRGRSK